MRLREHNWQSMRDVRELEVKLHGEDDIEGLRLDGKIPFCMARYIDVSVMFLL